MRRVFGMLGAMPGAMLGAMIGLLGCEPTFDRPPTLVDRLSILAVQAEPAEAAPGDVVTLRAAAADGTGPLDGVAIDWAFCTRPRSTAENTPVAQDCLEPSAEWIVPIAAAAIGAVDAQLPEDGCANFGSEPPPPPPGEDPIRPADPDATGGYYQPVRVTVTGPDPRVAFGRVRLLCALPSAPADVVREFRERYLPNRNPGILDLAAVQAFASEIRLRASWSPKDAEPFVVHDRRESELDEAIDSLRVSWFSNAGTFASDRTSPSDDPSLAENIFFPPASGAVHVWAVLRDSRGGMDWQTLELDLPGGK